VPNTSRRENERLANVALLGGVAALLGGLAWTVKGAVILAGGDQPPLLFEAAPELFGVALLAIAYSTMPISRRRRAAMGLGAVSAFAGFAALVSDLFGEVAGAAIAVSSLTLLTGLLLLRRGRWPAPLAWWIGLGMVPALLIGGMLSELDERLLEIPLVCLGVAWVVVGWLEIIGGGAAPTAESPI
jgi:hypothetical protein